MKDAFPAAGRLGIVGTFRDNEAFFLLCMQVFTLHIGQTLITPILPLYAREFGIAATLVGFLISVQGVARIFTNLPSGKLADRFGANRVLAVAAWIATLGALVGGLAPSYPILLLSQVIQGFAGGISHTAGLTYTANVSTPEKRGRFLSLFQGSFLLGNSVGPVVGGYAAQFLNYSAPFFIYAVMSVLVGIWIWIRLPDPRLRSDPAAPRVHKQQPGFLISLRAMIGKPGVILVSLIGMSAAYTRAGSRNTAISLLGADIGLSEGEIGLMLSIIFIATVIVVFLAGTLSDRFGPKRIITPSWLLLAQGLVILALADGYWAFLAGAVLFGLSSGLSTPVPLTYISRAVDEDSQGMALGLYRTFNDAGIIIGPMVMGWIADQKDIAAGVLFNAGLVLFVAVMFFILAPPTAEERARRSQTESAPAE